MIGHCGLLRAFSFARQIRGSGHVLDLPPYMSTRPETWVSLCILKLKLRGISRSSAILGRITPFIPHEKPNVIKHAIAGYLRLPWPTPAPAPCGFCIGSAVERRNQGTPLTIRSKIVARYEEAAAPLG